MAGRMGTVKTTTLSLTVHKVDTERGLLLIKGAIPGPEGRPRARPFGRQGRPRGRVA